MTEALVAAILANVRPEIRDEVAYAIELAETSVRVSDPPTLGNDR